MSNLLKSKVLVGLMMVAVVLVGVAVFAPSADAVTCTINSTLRQGSAGTEVQCLQTHLGISADGKFGPMTKAAVMSFQASNGLVADGVVGPMTRAIIGSSMVATPGFPAGCTSASGYSSVTGEKCEAVSTSLPAGCTSTSGYSSTTGTKCDSGSVSLPAGCTSTSGYSVTTGDKCDGGSTSTPSGELEGGAGSIDVTAKSTYSNEEVIAGDEDVKVLAFEVEADEDSDVEITSVKVELQQTAAGNSDRIEDYMDSVSIFMGSEKIGEADADAFSESNDIYTKTISLDGAIVSAGDKEIFSVAITAAGNLDSGDIDDDSFTVDVINVRFEDADGVVTTENTDGDDLERTFDFDDLASSGDLELRLTRGAVIDAKVVEVDDTSTTDVTMLEFKLKAEGSDMTIDSLLLSAVATGVDDTWADMVSEVSLEAEGDELDSVSAYYDTTDDDGGDLFFNDLDYVIEEGDTITFKVVAKIREICTTATCTGTPAEYFTQGDSFLVSFPAAYLDDVTGTDQTDVEDENGDTVGASDRTGSVTGEAQTFYSTGVDVDMGSVTYSENADTNGDVVKVTYTIPFTVSAFGSNVYLPTSVAAQSAASASAGSNGLNYEIENSADATVAAANVAGSASSITSSATLVGGRYEISDGESETFTVSISMDGILSGGNGVIPGFFRVQLLDLGYSLTSGGDVVNLDLAPETDYDTVDRQIDAV